MKSIQNWLTLFLICATYIVDCRACFLKCANTAASDSRANHSPTQQSFLQFSGEMKRKIYLNKLRILPDKYVDAAAVGELEHANQVIVYHGETVAIWLVQQLAKAFLYPDAKDWLPLRFTNTHENSKIHDLIDLLAQGYDDHSPVFTRVGLAAHVNLMSSSIEESAAVAFRLAWDRFGGFTEQPPHVYLDPLTQNIDVQHQVIMRLMAILKMIGKRCNWSVNNPAVKKISMDEMPSIFPSVSAHDLFIMMKTSPFSHFLKQYGGGVVLQIVMPPEVATQYCYASGPFGALKEELFLEYYEKHKNKLDQDGQLRIAMGHPFTRYPSPVKIKALSPIFQDEQLIHLIHKMIQDIVNFIRIAS